MPADRDAEQSRRTAGEHIQPAVLVAVMGSTVLGLYITYVFHHLLPMQCSYSSFVKPGLMHASMSHAFWFELVLFHVLTLMFLLCYRRAMHTDPGGIPDNDFYWDISECGRTPAFLKEWRSNGHRRSCKWCEKYKPDRAYHCRVCRKCILKMDHHCPWIHNCVGFGNYKFFFLLLLYAVLDLIFMAWTMARSVQVAFSERSHVLRMVALLTGESVSITLSAVVSPYFVFHIYLVLKGMSYIEFCERTRPRGATHDAVVPEAPPYNLGALQNLIGMFGRNPLLWLLPVSTHTGNGLEFTTCEVTCPKDVDSDTCGLNSKIQTLTSYGTWGLEMPLSFRVSRA